MISQTFCNGLTDDTRSLVNAASGGKWMTKTPEEASILLEELASQSYMGDEISMPRGRSVLEVDSVNSLGAKIEALTSAISKMSIPNANSNVENVQALAIGCELCGGPHAYGECPSTNREDANFVQANQQRSFQPSNQWKQPQHPGFSWSNQGASLNPPNTRPQNPPGFQVRQNFQNF